MGSAIEMPMPDQAISVLWPADIAIQKRGREDRSGQQVFGAGAHLESAAQVSTAIGPALLVSAALSLLGAVSVAPAAIELSA